MFYFGSIQTYTCNLIVKNYSPAVSYSSLPFEFSPQDPHFFPAPFPLISSSCLSSSPIPSPRLASPLLSFPLFSFLLSSSCLSSHLLSHLSSPLPSFHILSSPLLHHPLLPSPVPVLKALRIINARLPNIESEESGHCLATRFS